jgi:WD40 repeat protein
MNMSKQSQIKDPGPSHATMTQRRQVRRTCFDSIPNVHEDAEEEEHRARELSEHDYAGVPHPRRRRCRRRRGFSSLAVHPVLPILYVGDYNGHLERTSIRLEPPPSSHMMNGPRPHDYRRQPLNRHAPTTTMTKDDDESPCTRIKCARSVYFNLTPTDRFVARTNHDDDSHPEVDDTAPIVTVAVSAHGLVATGTLDRCTYIYDGTTMEHLKTLENHAGAVQRLRFSHDGKRLVSSGQDQTVVFSQVRLYLSDRQDGSMNHPITHRLDRDISM